MTTLHDRLDDLASDAPAPSAAYAGELWVRGRRRRRRQRAASAIVTAAAVAVVAGVVGTGSWWQSAPEPQPWATGEELRLPDDFFTPSPWLPSTSDQGEIGPLVAVLAGERGALLSGDRPALVGVAAATGEYRLLDLPYEPALWTSTALSPDGRHLAYWFLREDTVQAEEGMGTAAGWAVYDTVTGTVHVEEPDAPYGIGPDALVWSDGLLWVGHTRWDSPEQSSGTVQPVRVWAAESGETTSLSRDLDLQGATADGSDLVVAGAGQIVTLGLAGDRRSPVDRALTGPVVRGPDGRYAGLLDEDGGNVCCQADYPVVVVEDGTARPVPGGARASEVLAWRDESHVAVLQAVPGGDTPRYVAIDVHTGEREVLGTFEEYVGWFWPVVARDAWAAPVYDAREPDWPAGPWPWVRGGLLVLLGAGLLWRRRARA